MAGYNPVYKAVETATHLYFLTNYMSNFWRKNLTIFDKTFRTTEHAFMYAKAVYFGDTEIAEKILVTVDAQDAKDLGRAVKNFDTNQWSEVCYSFMLAVNKAKYSQNPELGSQLLSTGTKHLVEANERDKIWAVGMYPNNPLILDENNWLGQNLLGEVLMEVRQWLIDGGTV